jgi:hypothetical protein
MGKKQEMQCSQGTEIFDALSTPGYLDQAICTCVVASTDGKIEIARSIQGIKKSFC